MSEELLLLGVGIGLLVILVLVARRSSESGKTSRTRTRSKRRTPNTHHQSTDAYEVGLDYDKDGTPYGAIDAEFEDWG